MSSPPKPKRNQTKFSKLVTEERKAELFKNDPRLAQLRKESDEELKLFQNPGPIVIGAYRDLMRALAAYKRAHRRANMIRWNAGQRLLSIKRLCNKRMSQLVYNEGFRVLRETREKINWSPVVPEPKKRHRQLNIIAAHNYVQKTGSPD